MENHEDCAPDSSFSILHSGPGVRVIRRNRTTLLAAGILVTLLPAALHAQAPDEAHRRVYRGIVESVVAVRALAPLGERSGTGFVLEADGLILTSYAICPEGSSDIRVWTKGPRLHSATFVGASKEHELTLLRIKPESPLKPAVLGASSSLRVGQRSYTIGNAANSMIIDDQPSFNLGILSALYRLDEARANSTYRGPVFETTAAVNVGMEGAPCLDAQGRVVGIVTLNYSPHRFLGVAIPIDEVLPVLKRLKSDAPAPEVPLPPAREGGVGLTLKMEGARLVVAEVLAGGPADRAGISKGDLLLEVGEQPVRTLADYRARMSGLEAGGVVWFKLEIGGRPERVKLALEEKK